ncbi:uncharacterized protein EV420DRAFT_1743914 [Desarmillaria tabescens]|uniref:Fork-head domain-containing protein n=1 Tax=Armillaria tabescens TaxID=1929756 RepID=A0AA39TXI4_ARMTA|nr:uncharacterized protein EV420DRAFT_1743914 [Desarmillaria tabescens]KAK0466064.1 hypothetical protein EV420DRAFT_1743914 [Desarmillaria tabescens]
MYSGYPASHLQFMTPYGGSRSRHPPIPRSYARSGEEEDQPYMPHYGGGIKVQDRDSPALRSPILAPSPGQEISLLDQEASESRSPEMWARSPNPGYEHGGQPGPARPFDASGRSHASGYGSATSQRGSNSPPGGYPSTSATAYPPRYATSVTGLPSPFASLDPGPRYYRRHTLEQSPQGDPKPESPDLTPFLARADTQYDLPEPGDYLRQFLNLPRGAPVRLESLTNPRDRDGRPPYTIIQLAAAAIYSHPHQKASTAEIRAAILARFEYFRQNEGTLKETLKHALSSHDLFKNMGRTTTEPGRGGLWAIDITNPEGRRPRKRRSTRSPEDGGSPSSSHSSGSA